MRGTRIGRISDADAIVLADGVTGQAIFWRGTSGVGAESAVFEGGYPGAVYQSRHGRDLSSNLVQNYLGAVSRCNESYREHRSGGDV